MVLWRELNAERTRPFTELKYLPPALIVAGILLAVRSSPRHGGGGGGSDLAWDGDFWVYPLPSDGPVTFVVSWLDRGTVETRSELDDAAIREAAKRAVILWPEDPSPTPVSPGAVIRSLRALPTIPDRTG